MVSLNVDNTTSLTNCQDERTNFEIVQSLLRYIWKLDTTKTAFKVLLYQIDQEFCFIRDGRVKDGDKVCHKTRSRHLDISLRAEIYAVEELERLNVLTVERKHRIVNHYHINRDTSTWIQSSNTNGTSDIHDTIEYTFNQFQIKELSKYCDDLETEKLWLMSHGIPQDKAFGTLLNKLSHVTK